MRIQLPVNIICYHHFLYRTTLDIDIDFQLVTNEFLKA